MSIKKTIAVVSGKGGVGKSTITALLATKMSRFFNIGILDADIYGPNQAILLNVQTKQVMTNDGLIQPIKVGHLNMYLSTIAFFLKSDEAAIWRGPMLSANLKKLYSNTKWGNLDLLLIDMPPGTGDAYLTCFKYFNVDGCIMITSNSPLTLADNFKTKNLLKKLNIPFLGSIENMHKENQDLLQDDSVIDRIEYNETFNSSIFPFTDIDLENLLEATEKLLI